MYMRLIILHLLSLRAGKIASQTAGLRIHYKEEPYLVHTFYLIVRTCPFELGRVQKMES